MPNLIIRKQQLNTIYSGKVSIYMANNLHLDPKDLYLCTYINNVLIKIIGNESLVNPKDLHLVNPKDLHLVNPKDLHLVNPIANDIFYGIYMYTEFLKTLNIKWSYKRIIIYLEDIDNAYWIRNLSTSTAYFVFGNLRFLSHPSVVGHELTHALIENIAVFDTEGQSGALNESYADIFGAMFNCFLSKTNKLVCILRPFTNSYPYIYDPTKGVHYNAKIINNIFYQLTLKIDKKIVFDIFIKILYELHSYSDFNHFIYLLNYFLNQINTC